MPYPIRNDFDAILMAKAEASGAVGFSLADVAGVPTKQASVSSARLIRAGKLWKGKIGHRTMRLFAKVEWAATYSANRRTVTSAAPVFTPRSHARWAANAPIHWPIDQHGSALYAVTVCPPVMPRPGDPIRTSNYVPY